ncbi:hypothetical protein [Natrinema halophilum]|uniref:Uncharacterized protein n=1 Tax=Natrinema halophilum TaxID=1699371 RepID=A0A7D5KQ30_9EURY|nr:hypothetical protein [Natrinema halophilum]QLG47917.1 hypothetical protein HYG82_03175 [Natrinema halophilum]
MSFASDGSGPFCGALGCTEAADVVIDHPERGEIVVCNDCTSGYVVVRHV